MTSVLSAATCSPYPESYRDQLSPLHAVTPPDALIPPLSLSESWPASSARAVIASADRQQLLRTVASNCSDSAGSRPDL